MYNYVIDYMLFILILIMRSEILIPSNIGYHLSNIKINNV